MRKIFVGLFLSLDGVMESPETWLPPYLSDEIERENEVQSVKSDMLLLGRRTYQEFAAYWPNQTGDVRFADWLNNTTKLVASTTLKNVEWKNSRLIEGDVTREVTRLKQQPGKNITILGSATLVRSLLRAGLIDELGLLIAPIVLGAGRRLFENGAEQVALKLVDTRAFSTGVLRVTYEPAGR